jgi:hypothetical protein
MPESAAHGRARRIGNRTPLAALTLAALFSIGAASTTGAGSAAGGGAYCFGPHDRVGLPFRLFRYPSVPPRTDADAGYPYYPLTASMSANIFRLNSSHATDIQKYYVVWANHCNALAGNGCRRPGAGDRPSALSNPIPHPPVHDPAAGAKLTSLFTSYETADACTRAQVAFAVGFDEAQVRAFAGAGLTLVLDRLKLGGLVRDAGQRLTDVCVMPPQPMSAQVVGIMLDYEAHDGRTPNVARDFLTGLTDLAHQKGKRIILYTNPLDASGQALSGLGADNLNELQATFDYVTILLARKNGGSDLRRSFEAQMALLRAGPRPIDPAHLMVTFQLGGTTLADAREVRTLVTESGIPALTLWQNRANLSGSCETPVNREIACLTRGRCE